MLSSSKITRFFLLITVPLNFQNSGALSGVENRAQEHERDGVAGDGGRGSTLSLIRAIGWLPA